MRGTVEGASIPEKTLTLQVESSEIIRGQIIGNDLDVLPFGCSSLLEECLSLIQQNAAIFPTEANTLIEKAGKLQSDSPIDFF